RARRSPGEVRDRLARLQQAERGAAAEARWRMDGELPGQAGDPESEAPLLPPQRGFRPMPPLSDHAADPDEVPDLGSLLHDRADPAPAARRPAPFPSSASGPAAGGAPGAHLPVLRQPRGGLPVATGSQALSPVEAAQMRRGFRIGFLLPVAAALLLLGVYLGAPVMARHLPAAAPVLEHVTRAGDAIQSRLAGGILALFGQEPAAGS
ncbi:hypothetical protein ICN82_10540, partial [Mangrovicoccus sp. HB182678]|nr:hypothetical protein [Mangrovicoccus algicola]